MNTQQKLIYDALNEQEITSVKHVAITTRKAIKYSEFVKLLWTGIINPSLPSESEKLSIRQLIHAIRKELKASNSKITIETVHGFGFRIVTTKTIKE